MKVEGLIGRSVENGGLIPYRPSFAFAQIFISNGWRWNSVLNCQLDTSQGHQG